MYYRCSLSFNFVILESSQLFLNISILWICICQIKNKLNKLKDEKFYDKTFNKIYLSRDSLSKLYFVLLEIKFNDWKRMSTETLIIKINY